MLLYTLLLSIDMLCLYVYMFHFVCILAMIFITCMVSLLLWVRLKYLMCFLAALCSVFGWWLLILLADDI